VEFTQKKPDVGADLVGKVEKDSEEPKKAA
jgi:Na+/H+-translocating membrane pyrophosphatase